MFHGISDYFTKVVRQSLPCLLHLSMKKKSCSISKAKQKNPFTLPFSNDIFNISFNCTFISKYSKRIVIFFLPLFHFLLMNGNKCWINQWKSKHTKETRKEEEAMQENRFWYLFIYQCTHDKILLISFDCFLHQCITCTPSYARRQ